MKKSIFILILTLLILIAGRSAHAQTYIFSNDLSLGSTGQDVVNLQSWLIENGFDIPAVSNGTAKGYFGLQTKNALIKYQNLIGLPAFGFFGPMTRGKLNASHSIIASTSVSTMVPDINIISPNGGEVWPAGSKQDITLNVSGDLKKEIGYIGLALVPDPGTYEKDDMLDFWPDSSSSDPVPGLKNFSVTIPLTQAPGNYKIYATLAAYASNTCHQFWTCTSSVDTDVSEGQIVASDYSDADFTVTSSTTLLQICPQTEIMNQMPTTGTSTIPATYYTMNGKRYELTQFDQNWVKNNCTVPTQTVY